MEPSSEDEAPQPAASFEHVVATLHELVPTTSASRWTNALAYLVVGGYRDTTDKDLCKHDLVKVNNGFASPTAQRLCGQDKAQELALLHVQAPPLVRDVCECVVNFVCERLAFKIDDSDPTGTERALAALLNDICAKDTAWDRSALNEPIELEHFPATELEMDVAERVRDLLHDQWTVAMFRRHGIPLDRDECLCSKERHATEEGLPQGPSLRLELTLHQERLEILARLRAGDIDKDEYISQCAALAPRWRELYK